MDAPAGEAGVIRMGGWVYSPPGTGAAPAALRAQAGQLVALRRTAGLVHDHLAQLARIEAAYAAAAGLQRASRPLVDAYLQDHSRV
ncbi:hypothetical protein [Streptomyces sp. SGAir0957]